MGEKEYVELLDRYKGCLLGAAVGDALGMPTEFLSRKDFNEQFNGRITEYRKAARGHPCRHLEPGQYTDDTQQLLILAESLAERRGFDINDFGSRIGKWANRCVTEPGFNRFAGSTSLRAGLELYSGADPRKSGMPRDTCGAAMRIAPIGLFYHDDMDSLERYANDSASITHTHPEAVDSGVFVAALVAYLTNGEDPNSSAYKAASSIMREDSTFSSKLRFVLNNKNIEPKELRKYIGSGVTAHEAVPMAVGCFLYSPNDFEKTVINAANLVESDSDTIACMAGAFSGAHNGIRSIPDRFLHSLESRKRIEELAAELFYKSAGKGVLK